jgi:hypothetical protein
MAMLFASWIERRNSRVLREYLALTRWWKTIS